MADRKLTTAEILARARQQDAGGAAETPPSETPAPRETAPEPATAEQPGAEDTAAKPAKPAPAASSSSTPKSTKDILAAARAQAAGGGAAPKAESTKPPAKPGAAPKSTADILAAARAQAGGGARKPAAEAKPAKAGAEKPAAARPAARPSVQEMLKRARAQADGAGVAKKPLPLPQRPARARVRPEAEPRRNFLVRFLSAPLAIAWVAFTAASAAATLGMLRFMLPNVVVEPPSKFKIGSPDDYPAGTVTTKWKAEYAVWITNQIYDGKQELYALSTVCTHLGCTPNWLAAEQKFKCPCHGSGFTPVGINFEGPAPRPLERYGITIASDGQLEVDKSVKFQEEMGQWKDPASYVAVG